MFHRLSCHDSNAGCKSRQHCQTWKIIVNKKSYIVNGIVRYKPDGWVIIECPLSVVNYYRFWVEKFIGKKTSTSLHFPHCTVVAGKHDKGKEKHPNWKKYDGIKVQVQYDSQIYTDHDWFTQGEYFWLSVSCPYIKIIRNSLGLNDSPYHPPHLTVCFRGY